MVTSVKNLIRENDSVLRDFLTLVILPKITKTDCESCVNCLVKKQLQPFSPYPNEDSTMKYFSTNDFDVFLQNSDVPKESIIEDFTFVAEDFGIKAGRDINGTYICLMDRQCKFTKSEIGSLFDGLLTAKRHRDGIELFPCGPCENCEAEVTILRNSLIVTENDFPEQIIPLVWAVVTPEGTWEDMTQTPGFNYNDDEIPNEIQKMWNKRLKDILLRYNGHLVVSVGCIYDPTILNNYGGKASGVA